MRTRVIVWTIAGLLVVAGVIFLLATSRGTPPVEITLDKVKDAAAERIGQLDTLAAEVAQAKEAPPPGVDVGSLFAETERLIAEARTKLQQAGEAANVKQGYDSLRAGQELAREARRAFQLAVKQVPQQRGL